MIRPVRPSAVCVLSLLLMVPCAMAACGGPPADDTPAAAVDDRPLDSGLSAAPGAPCPETGAWRRCNLEKRLERSGFVVVRGDTTVRHPFLDVPGTAYRLGVDELQVFIYPSEAARKRDLADIDATTVSPPNAPAIWAARPTLITSNNLAAILIGGSSRQVERVQNALTAGLPRP